MSGVDPFTNYNLWMTVTLWHAQNNPILLFDIISISSIFVYTFKINDVVAAAMIVFFWYIHKIEEVHNTQIYIPYS